MQGFLPERLDRFAEAVLYPSFSPTVGVFLLCSAGYGLWKVRAPCRRGSMTPGSTFHNDCLLTCATQRDALNRGVVYALLGCARWLRCVVVHLLWW